MDVYKVYINIGNHIACDSLLSVTIVIKMRIISCFADLFKMHIVNSSAKTVSGCSQLADSENELH